jgi:hypothetical protein
MNSYNTITLITVLLMACFVMACVMIGKDNE